MLSGLQKFQCCVYLDDLVIHAKDLKEREDKFNKIMDRLRQANLSVELIKCEFLRTEVTYWGHVITKEGPKPNPEKIHAVKEFSQPRNKKNVQQFLGFTNY